MPRRKVTFAPKEETPEPKRHRSKSKKAAPEPKSTSKAEPEPNPSPPSKKQSAKKDNAQAKAQVAEKPKHDKKKQDLVHTRAGPSPNVVNQNYEMFLSQLTEVVPGVMNVRFYEMYKDAWDYIEEEMPDLSKEEQRANTLETFQQFLGEVPDWDIERIEEETDYVMGELPYLREALRQMLIARVTILMSVRHDKRTQGDFEFVMPPDTEIIHTFFIRAAKRLRSKALLYCHLDQDGVRMDEVEIEDNTLAAEDIVRRSLEKSIPALVPLQEVCESHLIDPHPEDDEIHDGEDFDSGEGEYSYEYDEEGEEGESYEYSYSGESSSGSLSVSGDEEPEEDPVEDADDLNNLGPGDVKSTDVPLVPDDVPADKEAAATAIMSGDSKKEVKLKHQASALLDLIEDLKAKRKRVPKKHKTVLASVDEEIADREAQLYRVKKKIHKEGKK